MKKLLGLFILFLSLISIRIIVKAETFKATDYIDDIFISRYYNSKDHPFKGQYIVDSKGNIVYCIEPYEELVDDDDSYTAHEDFTSYKDLSAKQIRDLHLLTYYGYGYGNRTSSDWYIVTQFLIWKTVSPESDIYFTDTYKGQRISKFTNEIKELENDVKNHDTKPDFVKNYTVNLYDNLDIDELNSNDYEIVSNSYGTDLANGLHLKKILTDGEIVFKKKTNRFENKIILYDNSNNQDIIKPGNINSYEYTININVNKGDITLDILKDTSVYTVESDFSNTCYEITTKGGELVDKVCANDEMTYKTLELPYGDYVVKQVSFGIGYKQDTKTYNVTIGKKNEHPKVTLENLLIKNTIEIIKYACKDKVCAYERGASFDLYDKLGNKVETLVTNDLGYDSIVLGYGTYRIEQISSIENYSLAESYKETIVDEDTEHIKTLFNYYIEPEEEEEEPEGNVEPKIEFESNIVPEEVNEIPPITGVIGIDPTILCFSISLIMKKILR